MLKANNLVLKRANKTIINDVSLSLQSGEVLGVLGTNGAGKSTLLMGLSGELKPRGGDVLLNAKQLHLIPSIERAKQLAILPQSASLTFPFSVNEVVGFGRLPYSTGEVKDAEIIEQILALVDISDLASRNYLELSGGERQKVHLARVLAQLWPITEQSVLLLDEPTSMLDPLHQHMLLDIVKTCAKQGAAVLVILHDLNLASRYCDQLLLLDKGKVFIKGSPHEVLTKNHIEYLFGLDVIIEKHPRLGYPIVIAS